MKYIKLFVIGLVVMVGLSACSASWLDNELTGGTLSQEDFDKISSTTEGSVRGLYSLLYQNTSEHHNFGQKSIDIATDLMSGDMAMLADAYGWFVSDAKLLGAGSGGSRNAYMWNYYYGIIMNANMLIRKLDSKTVLSQNEKNFYAQALTMRAYCYFSLLNYYTPSRSDDASGYMGGVGMDYRAVPIYTEATFNDKGLPMEQDLSTKAELFAQVHSDLSAAISYFNALDPDSVSQRTDKLVLNKDIARTYQAYTFLMEEKYDTAYLVAADIINNPTENYAILPYEDVLTTGFTDVTNPSWMWGLDVTVETTGGLATFWGHMDVFTYSYAQAGAKKGMDQVLYTEMPDYDVRKQWFDSKDKYTPYYKFYDLKRGTGVDVDRRWLNDIVFMRIEEVYLIAAEAAARSNSYTSEAVGMLSELLKERYKATDDSAVDPIAAISQMGPEDLLREIEYNWRVELWGEGKSLMTLKRFGSMRKIGNNNKFLKGEDLGANDSRILFRLPGGELSTNMAITYPSND